MPDLLFAEHAYQVRDLVQHGLGGKGRWIALGPSAMSALDEAGIEYGIPEDFYTSEALQAFCVETHANVEKFCDVMDERFLPEHPELKQRGMRPFLFHIKPLMLLFDSVRSRMFQWESVIRSFPMDTMVIHQGPSYPWSAFGLGFSNQETLWGHVAALSGWKARIEFLPDPDPGNDRSTEGRWRGELFADILKRVVQKSIRLTTAVRSYRADGFSGLIDLVRCGKKGTLLLVGGEYDWRYTIPRLRQEGWRVLFTGEEQFARGPVDMEGAGSAAVQETDFSMMECFRLSDISCFPLLKDRIYWIADRSPVQFKQILQEVEEVCDRYQVRGILRTASSTGAGHAINQAARFHSIPVFVWQHGAVMDHDRITQFYDYDDRMTADVTFVYGKGSERAYTSCSNDFGSAVVPVGSASLDAVQAGCKKRASKTRGATTQDGGIRILYATTNYYENHWYYGAPPGLSDRYLYKDQLVIMNGLREMAEHYDAQVVIKLHPGREYRDPPWVKKFQNSQGIRIVKDEADFLQLMYSSDVVVLDYPSTTLLQSLAAGLPVFVLMKYWDYSKEARDMLRRRAVMAEEPEGLMARLRVCVGEGNYPANLEDWDFLKVYGTDRGDGKILERAVEWVCRESEPKNAPF